MASARPSPLDYRGRVDAVAVPPVMLDWTSRAWKPCSRPRCGIFVSAATARRPAVALLAALVRPAGKREVWREHHRVLRARQALRPDLGIARLHLGCAGRPRRRAGWAERGGQDDAPQSGRRTAQTHMRAHV